MPKDDALPGLVLSAQEVRDLTGKSQRTAQMRVLDFMGIPYRPRPGRLGPAVLRIHAETPAIGASATIRRRPQLQP